MIAHRASRCAHIHCDGQLRQRTTATRPSVQDTTAPELTIPADYTVECSDDITDEAHHRQLRRGEIGEVQEIIMATALATTPSHVPSADECGNRRLPPNHHGPRHDCT